mmetsp:Transcript_182/g.377  ORF Transcript_182/g.377 Transcript_182/m.377 type:complete len:254 (-) Transcript_182:471-1232(-)
MHIVLKHFLGTIHGPDALGHVLGERLEALRGGALLDDGVHHARDERVAQDVGHRHASVNEPVNGRHIGDLRGDRHPREDGAPAEDDNGNKARSGGRARGSKRGDDSQDEHLAECHVDAGLSCQPHDDARNVDGGTIHGDSGAKGEHEADNAGREALALAAQDVGGEGCGGRRAAKRKGGCRRHGGQVLVGVGTSHNERHGAHSYQDVEEEGSDDAREQHSQGGHRVCESIQRVGGNGGQNEAANSHWRGLDEN